MRYVGPVLDARIRQIQVDVKQMGGGDIGYAEAGERLASMQPIIMPNISFQQKGKKKKMGIDLGGFNIL